MALTIAPDNMDYMANATEERARVRDKMPSTILNIYHVASAASSSGYDTEVGFQFSDVKKSSFSYHSYLQT
jgi:hypothetical protein